MSKRADAVPEETRQWILTAARDEFHRWGFQGSSLRRICAAAGVTTGALYFFFRGKDQLFETVINQVTEPFLRLMTEHYQAEAAGSPQAHALGLSADLCISRQLIDLYFEDPETWDIVKAHLNHPAVEAFLDTLTEASTEHYLFLLRRAPGAPVPDRFAIHQFVHMQTDAMLSLISHGLTREEMIRQGRTATRMLHAAFQALLEEDSNAGSV